MLHLNPTVMVAQVVTFLTALVLLRWIAYKPLTAILRQRAEKIRADLDAAEKARTDMEQAKAHYDREMARVRDEAQGLIQQAVREGQQAREDIVKAARQQGEELLKRAEARIDLEKEKALKELRQEVLKLSLMVAEKALGAVVTPDVHRRLTEQVFDQIEQRKN